MKILETKRLILRTWLPEDTKPFILINQDPLVREYFRKILTPAETLEFLTKITQHIEQHNFGYFATEVKATAEFIGFIGIAHVSFEAHFTPSIEIGWHLASAHWGKGYAPEGALAVLDYGFKTIPGLQEIVSFTSSLNKRSQRVMEKIGMKRDLAGDFNIPTVPLEHKLSKHYLYRINKTEVNFMLL